MRNSECGMKNKEDNKTIRMRNAEFGMRNEKETGCWMPDIKGHRNRFRVTGHRLWVIGYGLQVTSRRSQGTSLRSQVSGHKLQAASHKLQVSSLKSQVTGHNLQALKVHGNPKIHFKSSLKFSMVRSASLRMFCSSFGCSTFPA